MPAKFVSNILVPRIDLANSDRRQGSASDNPKSKIQYPKWVRVAALVLTFVMCTAVAQAQQPKKVPRIGYLSNSNQAREFSRAEAIRMALRDLGYMEGQNIATDYRYTEGKLDRLPELAAELVRLKVDIIVVAGGPTWVQAAKNATQTIPIVMVGSGADPVEAGLVESLARPGGNVTGLTNLTTGLGGKRLELLKEAVPKVARVACLYDPSNPATVVELKEVLRVAARALGLTIQAWEKRWADEFDRVFSAISKWRPDGMYMAGGGPLMRTDAKRIAAFALKSRLPLVGNTREAVDAGGLMYYGADVMDTYRRVAYFLDKILKGAKPADLPIEQPTKFEFVVNLSAAKTLGVTVPQSLLLRADEVIR